MCYEHITFTEFITQLPQGRPDLTTDGRSGGGPVEDSEGLREFCERQNITCSPADFSKGKWTKAASNFTLMRL
jgi:hypothetical protein